MTTLQNPISVFLSYAHEDELLLKELVKHLTMLKRQGLISTWYDRQIFPGSKWAKDFFSCINLWLLLRFICC
jgi:hypothetical protein